MKSSYLAYFAGIGSVVLGLGAGVVGGIAFTQSISGKSETASKPSKLEQRKAEVLQTEAETVTAPRKVALAPPIAPPDADANMPDNPAGPVHAPDDLLNALAQIPATIAPPKEPLVPLSTPSSDVKPVSVAQEKVDQTKAADVKQSEVYPAARVVGSKSTPRPARKIARRHERAIVSPETEAGEDRDLDLDEDRGADTDRGTVVYRTFKPAGSDTTYLNRD